MKTIRKGIDSRQDYSEELLYAGFNQSRDWKEKDSIGGIFSDSELGGKDLSQSNPWQGSQENAKSEQP
jgi:hypothetical protein